MSQTINNGQTLTVDSTQNQEYIVNNGTLNVVTGGRIQGPYQYMYPTSVSGSPAAGHLVVEGGEVIGPGVDTLGGEAVTSVQVTLSSGSLTGGQGYTMGGVATAKAHLTMTGGSITGGPAGNTGGTAVYNCNSTISGGDVYGGSGGTMGGKPLVGGTLNLSGGTIHGGISETQSLTISGGQVNGAIDLRYGPGTITGGTLQGEVTTSGFVGLTVHGGTFTSGTNLYITQGTIAHVDGGVFQGKWSAIQGSKIYVEGTGLSFSGGRLTGTLKDGNPIDIEVDLIQGSQVVITND